LKAENRVGTPRPQTRKERDKTGCQPYLLFQVGTRPSEPGDLNVGDGSYADSNDTRGGAPLRLGGGMWNDDADRC